MLTAETGACFCRALLLRPGGVEEAPAGCIVPFAMTQLDISATKIRALLSKRISPRYLMPDGLIAHIQQHQLYSENQSPNER